MAYSLEDLKRKKNIEFTTQKVGGTDLSTITKGSSSISTSRSTNSGLSTITKDLRNSLGIDKSGQSPSVSQRVNQMSKSVLKEASQILKDSKVHLIFFFDKSASCRGTEAATIAGYKGLIDNERKTGLPTEVTTILFDGNSHGINKRVEIARVPELYYVADGNYTAIYDSLTSNLKKLKAETEGEKTIVVIMTDGEDNASMNYNESSTREIIKECIALGWEFIFLGANKYAIKTGQMIGIKESNLALFTPTPDGYFTNFKAVQKALESFRKEGKVNPDWSKIIKQVNIAIASGESRENILAIGDGKKDENDGPTLKLGGRH